MQRRKFFSRLAQATAAIAIAPLVPLPKIVPVPSAPVILPELMPYQVDILASYDVFTDNVTAKMLEKAFQKYYRDKRLVIE